MELKTLKDVENALAKYIPATQQITGKDITLVRMRPLMEKLGNPEDSLRIVHIAGTSGKTSTAYYVAALLHAAGKRVGLTVSPHVDKVSERVQIDLKPLDDETFAGELSTFLKLIKDIDPEPTYFELLMAFVYWYFAKANVDYAVIETGLGGLHDATNVADDPDKVCIITDIGLDHMHVLGHTLDKIAAQKAGIIHPENHVVCYAQSTDVHEVIKRTCAEKLATLHIVEARVDDETADLPLFQQRNWHLARAAYDVVAKRDGLANLKKDQLITAAHITVPARMEIISRGRQSLILDGSHNAQKLEALITSLQAKFSNKSVATLVSFVTSKENLVIENLQQLARLRPYLIVTSFSGQQDTPKTSIDPLVIQTAAKQQGIEASLIQQPEAAFRQLLERPEDILLVTGSFYLLNHIRPLIMPHHD